MGPGNESHFSALTSSRLAGNSGATNSETAHPAQKHPASTITATARASLKGSLSSPPLGLLFVCSATTYGRCVDAGADLGTSGTSSPVSNQLSPCY